MESLTIFRERNDTVDILRGIAVFTMVAANLAGNMLAEPHPFAFRFYGTFSAPMFVMLSGMMVAGGRDKHGFRYYCIRGALVMLIGIMIDLLVWQYYPLVSFDVLYLIGAAMPVAYLASLLGHRQRWVLMFGIFVLTPLVQQWMGYVPTPLDWPIKEHPPRELLSQPPDVIGHFFADGWFPFFPWVAFALFGVNLHFLQQDMGNKFIGWTGRMGGALLLSGVFVWLLFPGPLFTRMGYSEMFYPPTPGYILTALGVVLTTYHQVESCRQWQIWLPWKMLGQCALFAYILQYVVIRYFFAALWPKSEFGVFAVCYVGLVMLLFVVSYGVHAIKKRRPPRSLAMRLLFGS